MDIGDAELLEIVEVAAEPGQIAGPPVDIADGAQVAVIGPPGLRRRLGPGVPALSAASAAWRRPGRRFPGTAPATRRNPDARHRAGEARHRASGNGRPSAGRRRRGRRDRRPCAPAPAARAGRASAPRRRDGARSARRPGRGRDRARKRRRGRRGREPCPLRYPIARRPAMGWHGRMRAVAGQGPTGRQAGPPTDQPAGLRSRLDIDNDSHYRTDWLPAERLLPIGRTGGQCPVRPASPSPPARDRKPSRHEPTLDPTPSPRDRAVWQRVSCSCRPGRRSPARPASPMARRRWGPSSTRTGSRPSTMSARTRRRAAASGLARIGAFDTLDTLRYPGRPPGDLRLIFDRLIVPRRRRTRGLLRPAGRRRRAVQRPVADRADAGPGGPVARRSAGHHGRRGLHLRDAEARGGRRSIARRSGPCRSGRRVRAASPSPANGRATGS